MPSIEEIKRSFDELYYTLKKNQEIIDWDNIEKELINLEAQIRISIVPSDKVKGIFSNKKFFPTQAHIKKFMKDSFNIDIKGKTNIEIFSEITYYSLELTHLITQIEDKIKSIQVEEIVKPLGKPKGKQEKIIDETWDDWTKLSPTDLTQHLKKLTVSQIKSITGDFLSSANKKLNKNLLIETIVNKINKLKAHN